MFQKNIFNIILKAIGAILFIQCIQYIPALISSFIFASKKSSEMNPYLYLTGATIPFILNLALVYVLLRFSEVLSEKIFKKDTEISTQFPSDWEKLFFRFFMKIIGLLLIIGNLPDIIKLCFSLILRKVNLRVFFSSNLINFLGVLTMLGIGVYLFLGAEYLIKIAFRKTKDYKGAK